MIFFTRELHEGYQDGSGWTKTADARIDRNFSIYKKYFRLIRPHLPTSAIALSKYNLHDCQVTRCHWHKEKLLLILDTASEEMPFAERYIHLTFIGVRNKPKRLPRKGEWWYACEFHLGSRTKFSLHVTFTFTDIEIPADEMRIKLSNLLSS